VFGVVILVVKSGAEVAFSVGETEGNDRPGSIRFCRCSIHKLFTILDMVVSKKTYNVKPIEILGLTGI
jgi:hypothetical protein